VAFSCFVMSYLPKMGTYISKIPIFDYYRDFISDSNPGFLRTVL
jgi:hypothetical protein